MLFLIPAVKYLACATMCYMKTIEHVGIRELRQNLSVYLRRVEAGEAFEVQSRGKTVAQLSPVDSKLSPLERMRVNGELIEATISIKDLPPPMKVSSGSKTTEEIFDELREDIV